MYNLRVEITEWNSKSELENPKIFFVRRTNFEKKNQEENIPNGFFPPIIRKNIERD